MTPPVKPRIAEHIADSLLEIALLYKRQQQPKSLKEHSTPKPIHVAYNAGRRTAHLKFKVKRIH